jgi:hypothetical protein
MASEDRIVEVQFVGFHGKGSSGSHLLASGGDADTGGQWSIGEKRTMPYAKALQLSVHNDGRQTPPIVIAEIKAAAQDAATKETK